MWALYGLLQRDSLPTLCGTLELCAASCVLERGRKSITTSREYRSGRESRAPSIQTRFPLSMKLLVDLHGARRVPEWRTLAPSILSTKGAGAGSRTVVYPTRSQPKAQRVASVASEQIVYTHLHGCHLLLLLVPTSWGSRLRQMSAKTLSGTDDVDAHMTSFGDFGSDQGEGRTMHYHTHTHIHTHTHPHLQTMRTDTCQSLGSHKSSNRCAQKLELGT